MFNISAQRKEVHRIIKERIDMFGFMLQGASDSSNPDFINFMHSIGLTAKSLPELIVSGNLEDDLDAEIIISVITKMEDGELQLDTEISGILKDYPIKIIDVTGDNVKNNYTVILHDYYKGKNIKVYQILLPDDNGYFPDNENYTGLPQEVLK